MEVALSPRYYQRKLDQGFIETTGAFMRLKVDSKSLLILIKLQYVSYETHNSKILF